MPLQPSSKTPKIFLLIHPKLIIVSKIWSTSITSICQNFFDLLLLGASNGSLRLILELADEANKMAKSKTRFDIVLSFQRFSKYIVAAARTFFILFRFQRTAGFRSSFRSLSMQPRLRIRGEVPINETTSTGEWLSSPESKPNEGHPIRNQNGKWPFLICLREKHCHLNTISYYFTFVFIP